MKRFAIFRKGKQTASSGATLEFSEADLRRAAEVYDPKVSPAPIVVGHPKLNAPAFGWVGALHFNEATGENEVDPERVDPTFAELVQAGRYRTRSASWYMPNSAHHPLAGKDGHDAYYLRHVGFLGAQAPAVKGLGDVQFAADQEGVVEFGDGARWAWSSMASGLRGLREWVISKFSIEEADKAVPNYLIGDIERAAEEARTADAAPAAMPAFSEEDPMTIAELQAQIATLTAERDALKAKQMPADFAERETALAAREAKVAEAEAKAARLAIETRVDAAIKAGRALPAQRKQLIDFAASLADGEAVIEFGEGDKAKKVSQREAYLLSLEANPRVVDYSERSGDAGGQGDGRPTLEQAQAEITKQVFGRAKV